MQILTGRYSPAFALLIISATALLIYSNTLDGPFLLDDHAYILKNPEVQDLGNFLDISGTRYITFLSFALNYVAGGYDTFGYHLTNLIIHAINGLLLWWLVLLTFKTPAMERSGIGTQEKYFIALGSALLFVSHPIQIQAVTYITQRFASLATLFYLLSVVLFVKWRSSSGSPNPRARAAIYILSVLTAVLAMKTKEISFTLPFIIILYEHTFFKRTDKPEPSPRRRKLISHLTPFILTLLILPLTLFLPELSLGGNGYTIEKHLRIDLIRDLTTIPTYDYLITQFRVIMTYLRLLIFPANQHMNYDYPVFHSIFASEVFLSFLFLSTLLGSAVYLFIRSGKTKNGYGLLVSVGVLWFFITLSVESSIFSINGVITEHRLYLPSVGMMLAFTASLSFIFDSAGKRFNREWLKNRGVWTVVFVIVVVFSVAGHMRNKVWGDEFTFWRDEANKSPNRSNVHINLGNVYNRTGWMRP
jgi:hypothetical protein